MSKHSLTYFIVATTISAFILAFFLLDWFIVDTRKLTSSLLVYWLSSLAFLLV